MNNHEISGTVTFDWTRNFSNGKVFRRNVRGVLESDGNTMRLKYSYVAPGGAVGGRAKGFHEYSEEKVLIRYG